MIARSVWWLLSWTCVVWYSTLTFYVAIKGFADITRMLKKLRSGQTPLE
jgi:hypothetical protein